MAVDAVMANKFRSFLTALGIIFGVGAVIAMLAIGKGARKEIIDQMKYVGVNNIIITPKSDLGDSQTEGNKSMQKKFSKGLSITDGEAIIEHIPTVAMVSPEVIYEVLAVSSGKSANVTLSGVMPEFFSIFNVNISEGQIFTQEQVVTGAPVCIIGSNIKSKFFTDSDPIGKYIKCGNINLKVIGVIEKMAMNASSGQDFGISNYNEGIYAPIQTVLLRYMDRSVVTSANIKSASSTTVVTDGNSVISMSSVRSSSKDSGNNQIDKLVVHVENTDDIVQTAELITKMLRRRHSDLEDFTITIPEVLLKQEQRTKDIFNIVLGAIASISLIVGGIGIMNIMLASVMERTKEIGTRLAIGATKKDIVFQFLSEATIISLIGGIVGILLGYAISKMITSITDILTIVSFSSILISFGVSATIGICFGYMPAKKAANQNPVESLRYE
jgi:putative ABC transport system permease protein